MTTTRDFRWYALLRKSYVRPSRILTSNAHPAQNIPLSQCYSYKIRTSQTTQIYVVNLSLLPSASCYSLKKLDACWNEAK